MNTSLLKATTDCEEQYLPITEYFVLKERWNDPQIAGTPDREGG